tara:strand:+ start:10399 stop:11301 length:903 start_codon:yes stop_codon:yes gene_type:complete
MTQAILSNHTDVSTVSEPWLMLYLIGQVPSFTEVTAAYTDSEARRAYCDLLLKIPSEERDQLIRDFVTSCYASIGGDSIYFLDKTPRYYLILNDLKRLFPDAKFIILKRNPIHVARSLKNLVMKGHRNHMHLALYHHHDLLKAPRMLQDFLDQNKGDPNVLSVKYEDLIANPNQGFAEIFKWIGLSYSEDLLDYSNNKSYQGLFGDPVSVSKQSSAHRNIKKAPAREGYWLRLEQGYVHYLGEQFLANYGYSHEEIGTVPKQTRSFDLFNVVGCRQCDKVSGWRRRMIDSMRYLLLSKLS